METRKTVEPYTLYWFLQVVVNDINGAFWTPQIGEFITRQVSVFASEIREHRNVGIGNLFHDGDGPGAVHP